MRLVQDARGVVSGTVTEGPGGAPEEGRIIGTCRRGRLQFLKLMPVAHVGSAEGSQELSAFLAAGGYEAEGPTEHPQLLYEGRLAADGGTVAGAWRLDGYVVPLKDGGTFYLEGGRLYSFWVAPTQRGESRGYVAAGGPAFSGPMDTVGA